MVSIGGGVNERREKGGRSKGNKLIYIKSVVNFV